MYKVVTTLATLPPPTAHLAQRTQLATTIALLTEALDGRAMTALERDAGKAPAPWRTPTERGIRRPGSVLEPGIDRDTRRAGQLGALGLLSAAISAGVSSAALHG